jgi:hypothetical protein
MSSLSGAEMAITKLTITTCPQTTEKARNRTLPSLCSHLTFDRDKQFLYVYTGSLFLPPPTHCPVLTVMGRYHL